MAVAPRASGGLLRELRSSYAFIERNMNMIRRYWAWEVVWLVYSIVNALSITFIGQAASSITGEALPPEAVSYFTLYLMVGTLIWHYLSVIFDIVSEAIQWERWEGTIEYTFMAPVSRVTHLLGQSLFAMIYGALHTVVILAVVVVFFQIDLAQAHFGSMMLMLFAGSLGFTGLGLMAAVLPLMWPEKGVQMTNIIKALILLVSGVYYPVSVLPEWLQIFSYISPATYMLEGIRAAMLEGARPGDLLVPALLPLLVTAALAIPLGLYVFGLAERHAKRVGILKRNG
ncbi:MAG: ABC transporter permease [Chloroflexaceae bacterium]|nr:ABC transporter permease [Chloroflexaceae bacterium]NJO06335.1 ABC transporter permease [Chloroflexaceae bacterium]